MRRSDFNYELPRHLIAQRPAEPRSASRLLVLKRAGGAVEDSCFEQLDRLLAPGDLLIFNDTKVLKARLYGRKDSGGQVEILIERLLSECEALAQLRASKAPRTGGVLHVGDVAIEVLERHPRGFFRLRAATGFAALMAIAGHVPLPPYIRRPDERTDEDRYQTVYARAAGAVAAPTAGLHFDRALLDRLAARGVESAFVTLHVGAGTFQPMRCEDPAEHRMHAERVTVPPGLGRRIAAARARGGRVVAVGTTTVRSLEAAWRDGRVRAFEGETDLFLYPGKTIRSIDALITNFHLPESTLLMLVCAFAGTRQTLAAYRHAVASDYRFYSYGDAMLVI